MWAVHLCGLGIPFPWFIHLLSWWQFLLIFKRFESSTFMRLYKVPSSWCNHQIIHCLLGLHDKYFVFWMNRQRLVKCCHLQKQFPEVASFVSAYLCIPVDRVVSTSRCFLLFMWTSWHLNLAYQGFLGYFYIMSKITAPWNLCFSSLLKNENGFARWHNIDYKQLGIKQLLSLQTMMSMGNLHI